MPQLFSWQVMPGVGRLHVLVVMSKEQESSEIESHVRRYVECQLSRPAAQDAEVIDALKGAGVPPARAYELVLWVPMAFGRRVLEGADLRPPETYLLATPDPAGETRRHLRDEEVFVASCAMIDRFLAEGMANDQFLAIAGRSAEFKAVNEALLAGSEMANLVLAEPVVWLPGRGDGAADSNKPWWRVW